jgi:formylglycine-generating enzyme required for sulfatase activity
MKREIKPIAGGSWSFGPESAVKSSMVISVLVDCCSDVIGVRLVASSVKEPDLTGLKMVDIPGRAYAVSETPVTYGQWEIFALEVGRELPKFPMALRPDNWRDYPVVNVSWLDAKEYIKWLNGKTGEKYRLPTKEEFQFYCGDHVQGNPEIAVYDQDSIQPVKTKQPNKYGLYDCLGLVWEWLEGAD